MVLFVMTTGLSSAVTETFIQTKYYYNYYACAQHGIHGKSA